MVCKCNNEGTVIVYNGELEHSDKGEILEYVC